MKKLFFLLLATVFCGIVVSQTVNSDYWDGVIYFRINPTASIELDEFNSESTSISDYSDSYFSQLIARYEITELTRPFKTKDLNIQNTYRIQFNNHSMIDDLVRDISVLNFIDYAEKSPIYRLFYTPSDSEISEQYYLNNINAYAAWDIIGGTYRTKLAIVDDAVKITHPDLAANVYINPNETENGNDDDENGFIDDINGWDVSDNDNNPGPPESPHWLLGELAFTHGTHCAGLAGAVSDNDIGIAAASFNHVAIIGVKSVPNSSFFPLGISNAVEGVDYAVAAGAEVVSMSFGGGAAGFETLEQIINLGHQQGIIFVAAAGNDGNETVNYPAAFENVIAVGATDIDDKVASFSQRGSFITVMAPGAAIYSSLAWSEEYGPQDGTSMSCPMVAGVIALLKSQKPHASSEEIINCLINGCDNIDDLNPSLIGKMGAGRINVYNSLLCLNPTLAKMHSNHAKIIVYPNPVNDFINVEFLGDVPDYVNIVDISGKVIVRHNTSSAKNTISVGDLCSGFYFIETVINGEKYTKKLIKE